MALHKWLSWRFLGMLFLIIISIVMFLFERQMQTNLVIPSYNRTQHWITVTYTKNIQLGNHMFIYASLMGIAENYDGYSAVLPADISLRRLFKTTMKKTVSKGFGPYVKFHEWGYRSNVYDERLTKLSFPFSCQIQGFLQSWKYFKGIEQKIRSEFQFRSEIMEKVNKILGNMTPESYKGTEYVRVGVHNRRGDMTSERSRQFGFTMADEAYFAKAMGYFRQHYNKVLFIVTSDDIPWSKQHIHGDDVVFSGNQGTVMDFALLATSDHVIMSVGTYGWWAAWIANGTTIYYKDWPHPGSRLSYKVKATDFFLPHWIPM